MTLIIRGLNKAYGAQSALMNINLSIATNNGITALLGANGSGKSTLLRVLATAMPPDSGWISFGELAYQGDLRPLRQLIGYLPQALDLPERMTPFKVLHYLARMKGFHERATIHGLLDSFGLTALANKPIESLSGGQVRLVGIAQALIGEPRLLLLDECLRGLDIHERERVLSVLRQQAQRTLILFSSQVPAEVEQFAQRIIVLNRGTVLFAGDIASLIARAEGCVYELRVTHDKIPLIATNYTVARIHERGNQAILRVISLKPLSDGISLCATLEDAYLLLRQRDAM